MSKASIIIPVYNEEDNVHILIDDITSSLGQDIDYEIICVDDGSTDKSFEKLKEKASEDTRLKVIRLARNTGQTAATQTGVDYATGDILVFMDADLQNDPADIPKLLDKLAQGYDVVSGWRKDRQDNTVKRVLPSRIANWIISKVSAVSLHDFGCTLKAYKRDVLKGVRLYGEMHRFIPIYAEWYGAKVAEVQVNHRSRKFGESKYGLERIFKVMLDILVIKFLDTYLTKPIYVFGGFGLFFFALSLVTAFWAVILKFLGTSFVETPLPLVFSMTFLIGIVCVLMGLLAEVISRTYFESQGKYSYVVKYTYNIDTPPDRNCNDTKV